MQYFVFRKLANKLEFQHSHSSYRDARQEVKDLRAANPEEDLNNFRLVFAEDEKQGRILLTTKKEASPVEEWET
jgi:hypothetical protein